MNVLDLSRVDRRPTRVFAVVRDVRHSSTTTWTIFLYRPMILQDSYLRTWANLRRDNRATLSSRIRISDRIRSSSLFAVQ